MSDIVAPGLSTDVVCIGETMALVRAESPGPLTHSRSMTLGIGGAESNVAIGLSRLGIRATWIGGVGSDSLGDLVVHGLRGEGVNVIAVRNDTAPTGLMIKERRTPATQQVTYYRAGSAGSLIGPADIPAHAVEGARVLHVTGITPSLSPSAASAIDQAVARAKSAGVPVSFDVNFRSSLWRGRDARAALQPILERADILFAGAEEAALFVGDGLPEDLAARLSRLGPREVVIKLGADGALALDGGALLRRSAVRVPVVDTVGAGDAFVAGYLAEWIAGLPVARRLDLAVRTGAFACMVPGDWEGAPRRDDLRLLDAVESVAR